MVIEPQFSFSGTKNGVADPSWPLAPINNVDKCQADATLYWLLSTVEKYKEENGDLV